MCAQATERVHACSLLYTTERPASTFLLENRSIFERIFLFTRPQGRAGGYKLGRVTQSRLAAHASAVLRCAALWQTHPSPPSL